LPSRSLRHPRALAAVNESWPGHAFGPIGFGRRVLISNQPTGPSHPVRHRRRHAHGFFTLAPRRLRHHRVRACRTNRHVAYPPSAHDEPDIAGPVSPPAPWEPGSMSHCRTVARMTASFDRDASLEVSSPSALASSRRAVRSSRAADDPALAFSLRLPTRASADRSRADVALAVFRSANAMR